MGMGEVSEDEAASEESFQQPKTEKLRGFKFEGNLNDVDLSGKPIME